MNKLQRGQKSVKQFANMIEKISKIKHDLIKPSYIVSEIDKFVICFLSDGRNIVSVGIAICSDEDVFIETTGKHIAIKRAKEALINEENKSKIAREDVIKSHKVWTIFSLISDVIRIKVSPDNMYKSITNVNSGYFNWEEDFDTYKMKGIK
jgi:hypothetical protein